MADFDPPVRRLPAPWAWYGQVCKEQRELVQVLRSLVALTGEESQQTQDAAWDAARELVSLHSVEDE